jgi:ketosteroid isomerase-like protein
MPVDLVEMHEEEEFGYTVAVFHYRGKDPAGTMHAIDSYFTLLFKREDSMWKVVADICTPIRPAVR